MTSLRSFALAFLLLAAGPALAQGGAVPGATAWLYEGSDIAPDPAWHFGTLDNGMRYAVRRNHRPEGLVSIRLRIDAGALHEADHERGWAHFVEHMLFRGTERYPDRRAREIWQQLGAGFGSDTNATTSPTDTVYKLDLPDADRADFAAGLAVLADMMQNARFDPRAVEAERRVVLAEMERRPELSSRLDAASRTLFYDGLRFAERDTIGTRETLTGATAEGLKAFYRRWYRPERTTLVVAGDLDAEVMETLIRERFGEWAPSADIPPEPDPGEFAVRDDRVETIVYEGAPTTASLAWLGPYLRDPHTRGREREHLAETLGLRILNRRLEAHARGDAAFLNAGLAQARTPGVAEETRLTVTARNGSWREALAETFAILRGALRDVPDEAEIERELANLRTGVEAAVTGEPTMLSQQHAGRLVNAVGTGSVVAAAAEVRARFEENAAAMNPQRVGAAMAGLFEGAGPRMILLTADAVEGGEAEVARALAAAEAIAPAERATQRRVSIDDLPPLGPPGREVSRERIDDMDVTIVRFANGSTLTFKPTEFEEGSVHVRLRFGHGIAGLPADSPSLAWLGGLVGPSGIAGYDLDAMERMLTGRRIAMAFGVGEEAFTLSGQTNAADLPDQLRLLAAKLAHPRWDAALFARFRTTALESHDLHFSSASARASREIAGFVRPRDQRWRPVSKEAIAAATADRFEAFFEPLLAAGPVHAIIVGDTDLDTAVRAMEGTVAALPARPEPAAANDPRALRPPGPAPEPVRFTHRGAPDQAYALVGWSTLGGLDRSKERRALTLAASLLQVRLFDRLREEEGATYSPSASHSSSEQFPEWGIFYSAAEIRPESTETFFRIAREEVAKLAAAPVAPDEFARAINPALSGIERRLRTNSYWLAALEGWVEDPREIETVRNFRTDYRSMTPEDVRAAVAAYVTEEGDWSMLVLPATDGGGAR